MQKKNKKKKVLSLHGVHSAWSAFWGDGLPKLAPEVFPEYNDATAIKTEDLR